MKRSCQQPHFARIALALIAICIWRAGNVIAPTLFDRPLRRLGKRIDRYVARYRLPLHGW